MWEVLRRERQLLRPLSRQWVVEKEQVCGEGVGGGEGADISSVLTPLYIPLQIMEQVYLASSYY